MAVNILLDQEWNKSVICDAIENTLKYENIEFDCSVEVLIVDADEIKELNNEMRNIDRVTDVLSFPMFENVDQMEADEDGFVFLGSMVICDTRAKEQAEEYGHSLEREAAFLAVHSTLHLLGYDHELGKEQEDEMFFKQEQVLQLMGLKR